MSIRQLIGRNIIALLVVLMSVSLAGCRHDLAPTGPASSGSDPLVVGRRLAGGRAIAFAGVGLRSQPAVLAVEVPVIDPSHVIDAAFYWNGQAGDMTGDETIIINGESHDATQSDRFRTAEGIVFFYKLDAIDVIVPGANTFVVEGVDLGDGGLVHGIGLAVIYEDVRSPYSEILTLDLAEVFASNDPVFGNGAVHNFDFPPRSTQGAGRLVLMVGNCRRDLTDAVWWDVGAGVTTPPDIIGTGADHVRNVLESRDGPSWHTYMSENLPVSPGSEHFGFQIESPSNGGDRGLLSFAAFCVSRQAEPPDVICFRGMGFWKHQVTRATGSKPGHQHVSTERLIGLLATVQAHTRLNYDANGDGRISLSEAEDAIDLKGPQSRCARARQHHLALLLNYASHHGEGVVVLDRGADGRLEGTLEEEIRAGERAILNGRCDDAKARAESINERSCDDDG